VWLVPLGLTRPVETLLQVDSLPTFLAAFDRADFTGFSVTLPHKEAALAACTEVGTLTLYDNARSCMRAPSTPHPGGGTTAPTDQPTHRAPQVDPVAARIGAVNTLIRLPGGGFKGYNTDWEAAVDAIEGGLGGEGTLAGRSVVVLGAGGAARALVFGALARGASQVTVANRTLSRATALAEAAGVQVRA
jgi:3-dehydroquinate dehydratase/shikimate dehydrogenase